MNLRNKRCIHSHSAEPKRVGSSPYGGIAQIRSIAEPFSIQDHPNRSRVCGLRLEHSWQGHRGVNPPPGQVNAGRGPEPAGEVRHGLGCGLEKPPKSETDDLQ
jgi:hypothetical protein